jgi:hypothetical protein
MDNWHIWITAKIVGILLIVAFVMLVCHSVNLVTPLNCGYETT